MISVLGSVVAVDTGRGAVQWLRHLHRHATVQPAGDARVRLGEHQVHQQCQWQGQEGTAPVHTHVLAQGPVVRPTPLLHQEQTTPQGPRCCKQVAAASVHMLHISSSFLNILTKVLTSLIFPANRYTAHSKIVISLKNFYFY